MILVNARSSFIVSLSEWIIYLTLSSRSTNAILKDFLLPRNAKAHSVIVTIYKELKD